MRKSPAKIHPAFPGGVHGLATENVPANAATLWDRSEQQLCPARRSRFEHRKEVCGRETGGMPHSEAKRGIRRTNNDRTMFPALHVV